MTNIPVNSFSAGTTYPKYVTDETLRQVVTTDEDGNPALRVVCDDVEPDLSEIEERIGEKTEEEWDDSVDTNPGSVISILKNINTKLTTPIRPPTPPPQAKVVQTIISLSTGDPVPFTDFQTPDPNDLNVVLTGGYKNILGIHHDTIGNVNEIVLYVQPSNTTETVYLGDLFQFNMFNGDTRYYVGYYFAVNGYVFQFTDGTTLEIEASRAMSRNFGKSLYMITPDDMIDFTLLFA